MSRWTEKPVLGSQINWSHPLSKGLVGAWLMNEGAGKVIDLITNVKQSTIPTWIKSTKGYCIRTLAGTNSESSKLDFSTGAYTIVAYVNIGFDTFTSGGEFECLSRFYSNSASDNGGWRLTMDGNGGLSFLFHTFNNNTYPNGYLYDQAAAIKRKRGNYLVVCTSNGITKKIYTNGIFGGSSTNTPNPKTQSTSGITQGSTNGWSYDIRLNSSWFYNRELSGNEAKELTINPYQFIYKPRRVFYSIPTGVTLSGTILNSTTETDIRTGGKQIILTLTGDTWVDSGATFDGQRQNIINGLDSAQSEATGWDAEVKAKAPVTDVVRTDNSIVTITLSAQSGYDITSTETITATVPATALTGGNALVATPTFDVTPVSATTTGYMTTNKGFW